VGLHPGTQHEYCVCTIGRYIIIGVASWYTRLVLCSAGSVCVSTCVRCRDSKFTTCTAGVLYYHFSVLLPARYATPPRGWMVTVFAECGSETPSNTANSVESVFPSVQYMELVVLVVQADGLLVILVAIGMATSSTSGHKAVVHHCGGIAVHER
jgi:hypothetical protein